MVTSLLPSSGVEVVYTPDIVGCKCVNRKYIVGQTDLSCNLTIVSRKSESTSLTKEKLYYWSFVFVFVLFIREILLDTSTKPALLPVTNYS